jgi:hypothetical protein
MPTQLPRSGRFSNPIPWDLFPTSHSGRQGRMADYLARNKLIILDELGYLPFAQSGSRIEAAHLGCVA